MNAPRRGSGARRPPSLLDLATVLLERVLRFEHPADEVVAAFMREHRELGSRERPVLAETIFAVLRRRLHFEYLAQNGPGPLERRLAILGWSASEDLLQAALTEVERAWRAGARAVDPSSLPESSRHNLPAWLVELLEPALGAEFPALVESLDQPAPLDVRVNALKARRDATQAVLAAQGIDSTPTPYAPTGLRIEGKPSLQRIDAYTCGEIEVQDEGSQLLALLTGARRGEIVVDFCAGAGGKTLALGAAMRNTGRLYAFDTSGHRLAALQPRAARSGLTNVHPLQITHEHDERALRLTGKADRVLVDAPCSGLGTLRRNPDLKWRQTPATVAALCSRQSSILAAAARLVKPGGRLIYATCSILESEDEEIAADFGAAHPEFTALSAGDALGAAQVESPDELTRGGFLRLWPHRHSTDGFFAALWTRR